MTRFEFIKQTTGVEIPKEFQENTQLAECYKNAYVDGYESVLNQTDWKYSICKTTSDSRAYLWNQSKTVICAYLDGVRDASIFSKEDIKTLPTKNA